MSPMPRKEKKYRGVYEAVPGSGVWWVCYFADGKRKREKVGRKSDAIALYQQRKSEIRAGAKLPANMRFKGEKLAPLLDRAAEWYKKHRKSSRTPVACLQVIKAALGDRIVDNLTADDVDRWLGSHDKWTPATQNRYKAVLSRALQLALASGHVKSNVARLVHTRREEKERVRYLSPEEETALRKAIREPEQLAEFEIALHTGLRKGEQYGLKWDDVDFDRKKVYVGRTKGGKFREIPMSETCYATLKCLHEKRTCQWVFISTRDKGQRLIDNKKWWQGALKKSGVKNFRWHDNRHTFASRLVQRGVDLYTVSKLMGHGSVVTTQIYAHLAPDHLAGAVTVLD